MAVRLDAEKIGGGARGLTMRLVSAVGLVALAACAHAPQQQGASVDANSTAPFISAVSPTSGLAGVAYPIELTILGRNFADTNNVVTFGSVTIKSVKSTGGGTRITVHAPKEMPSTGEVPPMPLMAGSYNVRVTTPSGASNAVPFALRGSP
jgi:hypothetical protein